MYDFKYKNLKDIKKIQEVFAHRAMMNGLSSKGEWSENLEKENQCKIEMSR